jgi:hypothetical protein
MDPIWINLLTFLGGLLLGNWLAIGRDRRREFNDAADGIVAKLIEQKRRMSPSSPPPTSLEIYRVEQLLRPWQRRRFRATMEEYRQARRESGVHDAPGGVVYSDPTRIHSSIEHILRYLRPR